MFFIVLNRHTVLSMLCALYLLFYWFYFAVIKCPNLSVDPHGEVLSLLGEYMPTNEITFKCEEGYQMDGPSSLTCGSDGEWNGEAPTCQPDSCSELPRWVTFYSSYKWLENDSCKQSTWLVSHKITTVKIHQWPICLFRVSAVNSDSSSSHSVQHEWGWISHPLTGFHFSCQGLLMFLAVTKYQSPSLCGVDKDRIAI